MVCVGRYERTAQTNGLTSAILALFLLEMACKLMALGFKGYWRKLRTRLGQRLVGSRGLGGSGGWLQGSQEGQGVRGLAPGVRGVRGLAPGLSACVCGVWCMHVSVLERELG